LAFQNPGGVRAGLKKGSIIYADLVTTAPFENHLHVVELPGSAIRDALEFSVSNADFFQILQVSGIKVIYDLKREPMKRIVDLKVVCQMCDVPKYEKIDEKKYYKVAMPRFLASGGDGFTMISENAKSNVEGPLDIDALSNYIKAISPMNIPPLLGRITFI
jgi:2',3'-cyclic-nucleotide 2'-phosphodiesterase (5'-nucleotidase family)